MSLRSRLKSALARAKARSKTSISKRKQKSAQVRKKISTAVKTSRERTIAKREAQKQRSAQQRREIVATAKAVATPLPQRTPEQLERTRGVAKFIVGAGAAVATGGIGGAVARGVGTRIGAKAVARGISKKSIERAGKLATGGLLTAGVVGTGVQAKRIAKGEAGAFETGFTLGGAGVLARPTGRVIGAVRQYVKPKVIVPKVKSVVGAVGVEEKGVTKVVGAVKTFQPRGRPRVKFFESRVYDIPDEDVSVSLSREVGKKRLEDISLGVSKRINDKVTIGAEREFPDLRGRYRAGIQAETFRAETKQEFFTRSVFAKEDLGYGTIDSRIFRAQKTPTDTGRGGRTIPKLKTQEKQLQKQIAGVIEEEQAKVVKQFRKRETGRIRRGARTRALTGIRQITPQVATQIGGQITRTRTGLITDTFVPRQKQREDTILKDITTTTPIIPTPQIPKIPSRPIDTTRTTGIITTGRIGGAPFIPLFRFGGAGAGGRTEARIGKEVGGRFTRSFSAEVLGIKAPRKRKLKQRYTGFELRI